jgi:hypothetical protein
MFTVLREGVGFLKKHLFVQDEGGCLMNILVVYKKNFEEVHDTGLNAL